MDLFYEQIPSAQSMAEKVHQLSNSPYLRCFTVGRTVLGRPIYGFTLGKALGGTLYAGGFHSQEWLTVLLLFRFLEELARALGKGCALEGVELGSVLPWRGAVIIPCVNVDGQDLVARGFSAAGKCEDFIRNISGGCLSGWNANMHGVDLNHNFDAGFSKLRQMEERQGITGPAPRQYGGRYPFSEPETRALRDVCMRMDIGRVMAFHSQGEEIYYYYGPNTPACSKALAEILASASGYQVLRPTGMASHGGFKDWFIDKLCRPGFTIEIGKGQNPLPVENFPGIYERLRKMLTLGLAMPEWTGT